MALFQLGDFILHSGASSRFKIECDALTDADWETLAILIATRFTFGAVEGVPRGGLKLAAVLAPFCTEARNGVLIVDDVLSTGASMEGQRNKRLGVRGVVIFARGLCPPWVTALWQWGF